MTWKSRIEAALMAGEFTEDDKERSGEWSSCAVGEHMYPVLGEDYQRNISPGMTFLGVDFCAAVHEDKPERAMLIYKEIQGKLGEGK